MLADRLLQSLVGTKNHCEEGACSNPDARKRNFCLEKLCQLQVVVLSKYWENLKFAQNEHVFCSYFVIDLYLLGVVGFYIAGWPAMFLSVA